MIDNDHNRASTIRRCGIGAHQKWVNKEIVIADDCSSKDTLVELKKLSQEAELSECSIKRKPSVAATRNRIIEEARGECISFSMMMRAIRIEFRFSGNVVDYGEFLQMEVRQFAT